MPVHRNVSPHIYALSTIGIAAVSYIVFFHWKIDKEYFFIPILGLALLYAIVNIVCNRFDPRPLQKKPGIRILLRKSASRYVVWLLIIFLGYELYALTPYYNTPPFKENVDFFRTLLNLYIFVGFPYFLLTLYFKASSSEDFFDPAIRLIHMAKQITFRILRGDSHKSVFLVLRNKYNRKVLLTFLMRSYFIPVMVGQVYGNMAQAIYMGDRFSINHSFMEILFWLSAFIWLTDTINASVAYCFESRWLENRTRSIDLTLSGWVVCLFSYSPLNIITSYIFPFAPVVVNEDPASLIYASVTLFYIVKILQVSLLALHVYIDLSLGPSVANITFKKLQTRGVYGLVRHPGTITKLTFWLLISGFYKGFWTTKMILGQLGWSVIYVLRALTEERHLKNHKEYQDYMKKVRYRFIPGVF